MKKKLTVKEILESKGKKKLTQVYVHTPLEANACEESGIDMIVSSENNNFKFLRENAMNTFFTVGLQYGRYLSEYEIIKKSFQLLEMGADAIYCPQSARFIKAITNEGIPVVGHTGFIPYKLTQYGGFKAYGKNLKEGKKILNEIHILQDAGAFATEIEIVPEEIVEIIYKETDIFLIGMGSGAICDAQYLFSEDILGYNNSHIPRHAKTYGNLKKNFEEIQAKSIQAYKLFIKDVRNKKYPNKKHHIKIEKKELKKFKNYLDK